MLKYASLVSGSVTSYHVWCIRTIKGALSVPKSGYFEIIAAAEINGETGVGYILKPTFFLPPLMLTQTEIESLLLGMQWVSQFGDAPLKGCCTYFLNAGNVNKLI